jgi:hypothetical protein
MCRVDRLTSVAALFAAACQSSSPASLPGDAGDAGGGDANSVDDAGSDAQATSCTVPSDCHSFPIPGPAVACCVHDACLYGNAALAQTCANAGTQNIMASNYDQSCRTDSDCVAIEEGNFCNPGANDGCTNAAINKSALAQYQADLAKTQAGVCYGLSGCGAEFGPCCQSGMCSVNFACNNPLTGDASADAGTMSATDAGAEAAADTGTD